MKTLAKWVALGYFALVVMSLTARTAAAQDDAQPGFDDPTAMAAPPAQFITPADVKKMMDNHDTSFQLVDTQPEEAFAEGHVPGAINYPWVQQVKPPIPLPRNKMLVLYCPCNHDEDSLDMYKKLAEFGYLNTKILEGGWYKWVALKLPVDGTDAASAIKMADAAAANGSSSTSTEAGATPAAATVTTAPSGPLVSGRQVGAMTPSLRVIDVTGKYKGQDTCYVCEYGAAPTLIGFFNKPSDQAADLIVKLDALVKSQKNLKGFVVMTEGAGTKEWLEKLAADKGIQIPLVYFARGTQDVGMRLYKLAPAADNTILVNTNRQVVANFVNVSDSTFGQVQDAAVKMLASTPATSVRERPVRVWHRRFGLSVLAALFVLGVAGPSVRAQSSDIKSVEPKDIKDIVAQNKGKVVVLNFFATWCVPCHTEFPDIIKLQNAYKGKGLQVIEVSMNDVTDKDELQKYLSETKPPFTVYIAANTEDKFYTDVDARWDTALPMTMIFDRDGKNIAFYKEARTYVQFEKDVTPLLAASAK